MRNPWATGKVYNGQRTAYLDVQSRIDAARDMTEAELRACLEWPHTQKTVRMFIERRLRKLERERGEPLRPLPLHVASLRELFAEATTLDRATPIGELVDHDYTAPLPVFMRRISDADDPGRFCGVLLTVRGHNNAVAVFNAIQKLTLDHTEEAG